ncbi:MAG: lysylphosphatidylglycerol synthase transmembrane domain-containing protein [Puniceicoccales bacterium]
MKKWIHMLGLLIFAWLLFHIGIDRVLQEIPRMEVGWFLTAIALTIPLSLLFTYRFHVILRDCGIGLSFGKCFRYYLLGQYYGFITPGKIGSFYRIYLIKDGEGVPLKHSFWAVVTDRIADIFGMGALACVGCVIIFPYTPVFFWVFLGMGLLALLLIYAMVQRKRVSKLLRYIVPAKFHQDYLSKDDLIVLPSPSRLLVIAAISLLCWGGIFFQGWIVVRAYTTAFPAADYILVAPIASIIGLIPVSVSGFGTRDSVYIYLLSIYGIGETMALTLSLLCYFVNAAIPSITGGLYELFLFVKQRLRSHA